MCSFAREDEGAPRQDILVKFCPDDLKAFRTCMGANGNDENKCLDSKNILDKCADKAFRHVNSAGPGNFVYWTKMSFKAITSLFICERVWFESGFAICKEVVSSLAPGNQSSLFSDTVTLASQASKQHSNQESDQVSNRPTKWLNYIPILATSPACGTCHLAHGCENKLLKHLRGIN